MAKSFFISVHEGHLLVKLARDFVIAPEAVARQLRAIADAVKKHGIRKVLIEGRIAGREMGTMSAFDAGSLAADLLAGVSIAICLSDHVPDEKTQLFKDTAQNRGARIEFFSDRDEALRWLGVVRPR